jgi:hypothetical protein
MGYSHEGALICERRECLLANGCRHCRVHVISNRDLRVRSLNRGDVNDVTDEDDLLSMAPERIERVSRSMAGCNSAVTQAALLL